MGCSSAPAIFERFSSGLEYIAKKHLGINNMIHILDDFLIVGPPRSPTCQLNLEKFIQFCTTIGVPIKAEKTENALEVITFMGLELDSLEMVARLPPDKLAKLKSLLQSVKRTIKFKDLQLLLGYLNFCCQVVAPGRCFLRRLFDLTKNVTNPSHYITLKQEHRKDIQAWLLFAEHFNGRALLLDRRWVEAETIHFHTDASGSLGYGAIFQSHWFSGTWPDHLLACSITLKELFPIVLALETWGTELRNRCIILHTDNWAVMHIINNQTAKVPLIMTLVRRLVLACMRYNILVRSEHIPGKQNILADLLSRLQVDAFHKLAPHMDKDPVIIMPHLLSLH